MYGDDHLSAIWMTPFLVAAFLTYLRKAVLPQNSNTSFAVQTGKRSLT
jgi:hypothetical protein